MSSQRSAPHAPTIGRVARLLGPLHVTGVFWYRFHQWGVRIVPSNLVWFFITIFTTFFFFFLWRIRKAIASNLKVALGPTGWWATQRRIFRTMWSFAWCLTERYESLTHGERFPTVRENEAAWDRVVDSGGFLMVTGHIGNWEIGSAEPTTKEQRVVHVVREEELSPEAQEFIRNLLRNRMGARYHTHFASGDPRLGLQLLEALRKGEIVALQGDRPREGGKTLKIRLFDRPFELPQGPLALARSARVPLLPVFVVRDRRKKYRVCFREPIHVADTGDRRRDLLEAAKQLGRSLEWIIRERPFQWFCFKRLWPD